MSRKPTYEELEEKIAELEESKEFFENLLDMLPELVSYIDKNHTFKFGNKAYQNIFDIDPSSMIGLHPRDVIGEEAYQNVAEKHKSALSGQQQRYESSFLLPSGDSYFFDAHYVPHQKDGQIKGFLAVVEDTTERKRTEANQRKLEAQLYNAMEIAQLGHWEYDIEKDLFTFNDQFYKIFRTNVEQVGGYFMSSAQYAKQFVHPGDRDMIGKEIRKTIQTSDPNFNQQLEHRILYADGEVGYITVRYFIVKDDQGKTVKTYGVNQDITDRRMAEEKLQEAILRQNEAIRAGNVGLWDWDLQTNKVTYSREWKQQIGYEEHEISNDFREWRNRVHPEDLESTFNRVNQSIAEGNPNHRTEFRFRHKDGSYRWILAQASILKDESGNPVRMLGSHVDISELKRVEQALKESEERFRLLFNNSADAHVLYRGDQFIECNQASLQMLGFNKKEALLALHPGDISPMYQPDGELSRDKADAMIALAFEKGSHRFEWLCKRSDESKLPLDVVLNAISIGGEMLIHAIWRDISQQKAAEEVLRKSEKEFKDLFDYAPMGYVEYDQKGKIVRVNQTYLDMLGYKREEILGKFVWDFYIEKSEPKEQIIAKLEGRLSPGREVVRSCRRKDGSVIPALVEDRLLMDSEKGILGIRCAYQDITERKRVENALSENASQLRKRNKFIQTILDNLPIGLAINYFDEGTATYINRQFEEIYGWPEEELKNVSEFFEKVYPDPEYRQEIQTQVLADISSGDPERMQWDDLEATQKDGSKRIISAKNIPIFEQNFMISTVQDITERKHAEQALLEIEKRFKELVEMLPEAVFETDANLNLKFVNQMVYEITGYTELDFDNGLNGINMLAPESRDKAKKNLLRRTEGERVGPVEYIGLKKDGSTYPVLLNTSPIIKEGRIVGFRGVLMDITNLKEIEEQLHQAQKMESIGSLAGGIAHEFNNVLGIIMGNTELAIEAVPDWSPAKESLKEIRKASLRAKDVVHQILSFARKTMTSLKPLEINTIIKESLKLMRASIPTMVDIQQNIPSEPKVILGDPTEIHQIMINLCTNASHAMKQTGGILEVSISEVALDEKGASGYEDLSSGNYVKLIVKDGGEGIAPDVLEKVFEPYFTTKEFGAGSGMGLAVVHGIVKKCKGAINIQSTVGEGTTVGVLFPKIEEATPSEEKKELELPKGNERILLVDDDQSIVTMISQMLKRFGYTVTSMTDSSAALEQFKSTPEDFDLVVTDMAMPSMSGDQLAAKLIKVREDIPILLCTGHSYTIDEKKAKEIGIKGFAMKPLDMGELARAVRALLDDN